MKSGFGLCDPKGAPHGGLTVRERARLAVLRRERRQAAEWRAEVFRRYRERGFRSPSPPRAPVEP